MRISTICNFLFLIVCVFLQTNLFAQSPSLVNFRGQLLNSGGQPVTSTVSIDLRVFPTETGGAQLYLENVGNVEVRNGQYAFQFGTNGSPDFSAVIKQNAETWVELTLDGNALPRQRFVSVPYALSAGSSQITAGSITREMLAPGILVDGNGSHNISQSSSSISNPFGWDGVPVLGEQAEYVVPTGKILILLGSSGVPFKIEDNTTSSNVKNIRSHESSASFLPSGTKILGGSSGWSAFLVNEKTSFTPIFSKGENYTVPQGKVLVMTSSIGQVKIPTVYGDQQFRHSASPPSIIPAGTVINSLNPEYGWSGYLTDLTSLAKLGSGSSSTGIGFSSSSLSSLFMPYGYDGEVVIGGSTYTVPDGKVLVTSNYHGYVTIGSNSVNSFSRDSSAASDVVILPEKTTFTLKWNSSSAGSGFIGMLFDQSDKFEAVYGGAGYTVPSGKKLYVTSAVGIMRINGNAVSFRPTIGRIPMVLPSQTTFTLDTGPAQMNYGFSGYLVDENTTLGGRILGGGSSTPAPGSITKSMLAQEVLADLNASPPAGSITKSMLSSEVLTDLNRTQSVIGTSDDAFTEGLRAYLRPMLAGGVWHSWGLEGMAVTLKAPKVDGRFLTYQWYKGGSPISGATGTEYIIPDFKATRDAGDYEIRVSNAFATLKTKAVLQVGSNFGINISSTQNVQPFPTSIILKSNGSIHGTGNGSSGLLGNGLSFQSNNFVHSKSSEGNFSSSEGNFTKGFSLSSVGDYHALYLHESGVLFGVGNDNSGALGINYSQTGYVTPIPNIDNVSKISTGAHHTMVVKNDGTLWGMGINGNGRLGDGTTTNRNNLVQISGVSNVAEVSAGKSHTMFLKTDGTLWGMGYNGSGRLGDGTTNDRYSPVQIPGVSNVAQVSSGYAHTLYIKADGTLWAMGSNNWGQLGDGTTTDRNSPVQISGVSNVSQVSAGYLHNMVIKTDGTLWAFGRNDRGQLGDGTTVDRVNPTQVPGVTSVVRVVAGTNHTMFVKADGTLWAMGDNSVGQFGNGTTISSSTPVQVGNIIAMEEQPFAPESVSDVVQSERPSSERSTHIVQSAANLEMIWVESGTFTMGSPITEVGRGTDETEHNVTLTKGFYLGKYEVTQAQYKAVMSGNTDGLSATPSYWPNNPNRSVEQVNWDDVQIFLTRLNSAEQAAGRLPAGWSYVLPTESQWEYACRAGTTTAYSWGVTIASSNANYNWDGAFNTGSDFQQTRDVGQYAANPWGFFDMHGNVWEWTADWYQETYPSGNPVVDPTGPTTFVPGSWYRVLRGGAWYPDGTALRAAKRSKHSPSDRRYALGFRLGFQQQ